MTEKEWKVKDLIKVKGILIDFVMIGKIINY